MVACLSPGVADDVKITAMISIPRCRFMVCDAQSAGDTCRDEVPSPMSLPSFSQRQAGQGGLESFAWPLTPRRHSASRCVIAMLRGSMPPLGSLRTSHDTWRPNCDLCANHLIRQPRAILLQLAHCVAAVADRPHPTPGASRWRPLPLHDVRHDVDQMAC